MALDPTKSVFAGMNWKPTPGAGRTGVKEALGNYVLGEQAVGDDPRGRTVAPNLVRDPNNPLGGYSGLYEQGAAPVPPTPQEQSQAAGLAYAKQQQIMDTVNPQQKPMVEAKADDLAHIAEAKRLLLGGRQEAERKVVGLQEDNQATNTPIQNDLRTMSLEDLRMKYGDDVADNRYRLFNDMANVTKDQMNTDRTAGEVISDSAVTAVQGGAGLITSAGAMIGGLIGEGAGSAASEFQAKTQGYFESKKSEDLQSQLVTGSVRDALDSEDNQIQYNKDIASGDSTMVADFKKVGRDFLSTTGNIISDPSRLADSGLQVIGELAVTGGVGGLVRKIATPVIGQVGAKKLAELAVTAGVGTSTGGDAYAGAVNEVLGRSEEQLRAESPEYVKLRESGIGHKAALTYLAHEAGLYAAAIALPVGIVGGAALSKFEAAPLIRNSGKYKSTKAINDVIREGVDEQASGYLAEAANVVLGEGVQEAVEEGVAQFGANVGIRASGVDAKQSLTEGVGQAAAEGAAGGLGGAAVVRGPGMAAGAAVKGVVGTAKAIGAVTSGVGKATAAATEAVQKTNANATTASTNISTKALKLTEAAKNITEKPAPNEVGEVDDINEIRKGFSNVFEFDKDEYAALPESVRDSLLPDDIPGTDDEIMSMKLPSVVRLAQDLENNKFSGPEKDAAVLYVKAAINSMEKVQGIAKKKISQDMFKAAGMEPDEFEKVLKSLKTSKAVRGILNQSITPDMVERLTAIPQKPTTEQLNSIAASLVQISDVSPEMVNPERVDFILEQVKAGKVKLNQKDQSNLEFVSHAQSEIKKLEAFGTGKNSQFAKMRERLIYGDRQNADDPSLMNIITNITGSLKNNNLPEAQRQMSRFAYFRESQRLKLEAMLKSKEGGKGEAVPYPVLQSFGWTKDREKVFYNADSPASAEHLTNIENELAAFNSVYEKMKALHPELVAKGIAKSNELKKSSKNVNQVRTVAEPVDKSIRATIDPADPKSGIKRNKNRPDRKHFDAKGVLQKVKNAVTIPGRQKRNRANQEIDLLHAERATKYIGVGITKGDTDNYLMAYKDAGGDRANSENYTSEDVVFVKADFDTKPYKGGDGSITAGRFNERLLQKAVDAGATVLIDSGFSRKHPRNNAGRAIRDFLVARGYVHLHKTAGLAPGELDPNSGVMVPMSAVGMAEPSPAAATPPADLAPPAGRRGSMKDIQIEADDEVARYDAEEAAAKAAKKPYRPRKGTLLETSVGTILEDDDGNAAGFDKPTRKARKKATKAETPPAETPPAETSTETPVDPLAYTEEDLVADDVGIAIDFYHGTDGDFDTFNDGPTFFTTRKGLGREFALNRKASGNPLRLVQVNLMMKNPYLMVAGKDDELSVFSQNKSSEWKAALDSGEYDGVLIYNENKEVLAITNKGAQVAVQNKNIDAKPDDKPAGKARVSQGNNVPYNSIRPEGSVSKLTDEERAQMSVLVPPNNINARYFEAYRPKKNAVKNLFSFQGPGNMKTRLRTAIFELLPEDHSSRSFWDSILDKEIPNMVQNLNLRLNEQLNENNGALRKELESNKLTANGKAVMDRPDGRHLTFIEVASTDAKGINTYRYIPEVSGIVSMAMVQWLLTEAKPMKDVIDDAAIASTFGVPEVEFITAEMRYAMESGTYRDAAVDRLKQLIEEFMGVEPVKDISATDADGMLMGLAAEVMASNAQDRTQTLVGSKFDRQPVVNPKQVSKLKYLNRDLILVPAFEGETETSKSLVVVNVDNPEVVGSDDITGWKEKANGFDQVMLEVLSPEADKPIYVGKPPVSEQQNQLRSSVGLSKEEKQSLENEENKPHKLNIPLLSVINGMTGFLWKHIQGYDSDLEAFSKNKSGAKIYNIKDMVSIEGRNVSINTGYEAMISYIKAGFAYAGSSNMNLEDVDYFFKKDITVVGRHQEKSTGPVADKQVRQMLVPTKTTMDMNDPASQGRFWVSIAQAMGVKTEQAYRHVNVDTAKAMMKEPFRMEALEILKDLIKRQEADQNTKLTSKQESKLMSLLVQDDGSKLLPDQPSKGFDALIHVARLQMAEEAGNLKDFQVTLALEADGKTDGPIHAMMNFAKVMSVNFINNMGMGGMFFNKPNMTLNKMKSESTAEHPFLDLYGTSGNIFKNEIEAKRGTMGQANGAYENMLKLLNILGAKNFEFNAKDQTVTIGRNLMKNPLTVSVYGAGLAGIADKIVDVIMVEFHKQMTDQANIDDSSYALVDMPIYKLMQEMVNTKVVFSKGKNKWYTWESDAPKLLGDPENMKMSPSSFRLNGKQYKQMSDNIKLMFASDMVASIQQMMGTTKETMSEMQFATKIQGLVVVDMFNTEVAAMQATRFADGGLRAPTDELSEDDYNAILKKIMPYGAVINMPTQNANMTASERMNIQPEAEDTYGKKKSQKPAVSRSRDDRFNARRAKVAPSEPGVKVAPYITIMTGDGQMILRLTLKYGADGKMLFVYDGVEMAMDKIDEYGLGINEAVADGWKANYVRYFAESFDRFVKLDPTSKISEISSFGILTFFTEAKLPTGANLRETLQLYSNELWKTANKIEARKIVMDRYGYSVDHMASAEQPYTHDKPYLVYRGVDQATVARFEKGVYFNEDDLVESIDIGGEALVVSKVMMKDLKDSDILLEGPSLAAFYQAEIEIELDKLEASREKTNKTKMEKEADTIRSDDRFQKELEKGIEGIDRMPSRPNIFKANARTLYSLARRLPVDDRNLLNSALKIAKKSQMNFYFGKKSELQKLRNDMNQNNQYAEDIDLGQISFADRAVFIASGSIETVVHEAVHAGVTNQLYVALSNPQAVSQETREATDRLTLLLEEFLLLKGVKGSEKDLYNAQVSISKVLTEYSKEYDPVYLAGAISEMLAWSLSNQNLKEQLQRTKIKNPAAILVIKAMRALGKLLGISPSDPKSTSMFAQLRFNAKILMADEQHIRATTPAILSQTVANANQNPATANPNAARLDSLTAKMEALLGDHWNTSILPTQVKLGDEARAYQVTHMFKTAGFSMDIREEKLFNTMQLLFQSSLELDSQAMQRAAELHRMALKDLTVESLMEDIQRNDPNDRLLAQNKFNALTGSRRVWKDLQGRSNLLSSFLAASMIDPQLSALMSNISTKEVKDDSRHASDNIIDWGGEKVFDYFGDKLNTVMWDGYKNKSIGDTIGEMLDKITVLEIDAQDNMWRKTELLDDKLNKYISESIGTNSAKVLSKLSEVTKNTNSKTVKAGAYLLLGVGSLFNKQYGTEFADFITHALNGERVWTPLREFFAELRGTGDKNSRIHELVNKVRALVSQSRQQFRDSIPHTLAQKFSRKLTKKEWTDLSKGMNKIDIGNLHSSYRFTELRELYQNDQKLIAEIAKVKAEITSLDKRNSAVILRKADALATYMVTGETTTHHLLKNSYAIAKLVGEGRVVYNQPVDPALIKAIDNLVGLQAMERMAPSDKEFVGKMMAEEPEAMEMIVFLMANLDHAERNKSQNERAKINHIKGQIDTVSVDSGSVIIANDSDAKKLGILSYARVGKYYGPMQDESMGYYYSPVNGQSTYHQGAMQTVQKTMYGVDATSGFNTKSGGIALTGLAARSYHTDIMQNRRDGLTAGDFLHPVFDDNGVVFAYERSVDPQHLALQNYDENLGLRLGAWKGRQEEEKLSDYYNEELLNILHDTHKEDTINGLHTNDYINLADATKRDKVQDHIWKVIPDDMKKHIETKFGKGKFFVRRDMLNDALGYPAASIGDMFTGKTRMPQVVQDVLRNSTRAVFGDKAYQYLLYAERGIQTVVTAAKVTIVIKSGIVPLSNLISNFQQLMMNGVPMRYFGKRLSLKVKETNTYVFNRNRQAEIETELAAYKNSPQIADRLKAEYKTLEDTNRRLSIWPLIEKGEFNTIADGLSEADRVIHTNQLFNRIEEKLEELPNKVKDVAQYAYVSRNTSLFKLLNRTTQYGDFISKALLYDHLMENKEMTAVDAYKIVRNEFVNYNLLPGRTRTLLESTGLIWFWNFKIRSVKVALRIMQDNPLKALIWSHNPLSWVPLPGIGQTVLTDNLMTKAVFGGLDKSTGPGMMAMIVTGNPWYRLVN